MKKYNVGDKVILDGEETEIIAIAYDEVGVEIYSVKGSLKDHYAGEFESLKGE